MKTPVPNFELRVSHLVRRRPRFRYRRLDSIDLSGDMLVHPPPAAEIFGTFRLGAGVGGIRLGEPIIDSDPRNFSRIVIYACAIRRGELPEFGSKSGLRFAGPAAASLVDDAQIALPAGTVFPGFTCYGQVCHRSAWITLVNSFRSGTGRRSSDYSLARAGLAGSANVNFVACVE